MNAILRTEAVTRRFGTFTAVDTVSLAVGAGEAVGLLGANGAGKTTVIRMLLGLLAPSAGTVTLFGGPPDLSRRARLGYVPQNLGLYRDLTVAENLEFGAAAYGVAVPALPEPLAADADVLVGDLPLGTQRQAAFFLALAHAPEALVLDEPTSGVDALARARLWDVLREQADRGVAVLVTTHYMEEAQQCDRLLLMADGRLVAAGDEQAVIGDTRTVAVRGPDWTRTFAALDEAGIPVILAGRDVRVPDTDETILRKVLSAAGIEAEIQPVPATIEERMLTLSRETGGSR
ncbi:ABC transporter ATP-binding protein [Nocardia sp. SSK8]|uniref:ABC transporter ATP-binding protein n=1 Tax=Nocardia sp. SSK8 TaxID=3120154 RepID=UPI0030083761